MKRLHIALTTRSTIQKSRMYYDFESYFEYVKATNNTPAMVKASSQEEADDIAELFDGLIITGGEDVNPAMYHKENTYSEPIDEDIEASDIYLYNAFKKLHKPILGICRGLQVIAAIEGAELVQDIRKDGLTDKDHNQSEHIERYVPYHTCHFIKGTRLYDIFSETDEINSYHHQVAKEVPNGFQLSAKSDDGLIEGFEKDNIICVQWHPERLFDRYPKHLKILQLFLEDCLLRKTK